MDAVSEFMRRVPQNSAFGGINPRQASPLWVRPIHLDDHYGLLFTVLASSFRGSDYSRIQSFLDNVFPPTLDLKVPGWNT
jgi:hypothetical protein